MIGQIANQIPDYQGAAFARGSGLAGIEGHALNLNGIGQLDLLADFEFHISDGNVRQYTGCAAHRPGRESRHDQRPLQHRRDSFAFAPRMDSILPRATFVNQEG